MNMEAKSLQVDFALARNGVFSELNGFIGARVPVMVTIIVMAAVSVLVMGMALFSPAIAANSMSSTILPPDQPQPFDSIRHPSLLCMAPVKLFGVVIAAPHGGFDMRAPWIAREAAAISGAGFLSGTGWRVTSAERFINVNRPTQAPFILGVRQSREVITPAAEAVFRAWSAMMPVAAGIQTLPVPLYVEIHGHSRKGPSGRTMDVVEVATVNISRQTCLILREKLLFFLRRAGGRPVPVFFQMRDKYFTIPGEKGKIPFRWSAMGARTIGSLAGDRVVRAVHIELPPSARKSPVQRRAWARAIAELVEWMTLIYGK